MYHCIVKENPGISNKKKDEKNDNTTLYENSKQGKRRGEIHYFKYVYKIGVLCVYHIKENQQNFRMPHHTSEYHKL